MLNAGRKKWAPSAEMVTAPLFLISILAAAATLVANAAGMETRWIRLFSGLTWSAALLLVSWKTLKNMRSVSVLDPPLLVISAVMQTACALLVE